MEQSTTKRTRESKKKGILIVVDTDVNTGVVTWRAPRRTPLPLFGFYSHFDKHIYVIIKSRGKRKRIVDFLQSLAPIINATTISMSTITTITITITTTISFSVDNGVYFEATIASSNVPRLVSCIERRRAPATASSALDEAFHRIRLGGKHSSKREFLRRWNRGRELRAQLLGFLQNSACCSGSFRGISPSAILAGQLPHWQTRPGQLIARGKIPEMFRSLSGGCGTAH